MISVPDMGGNMESDHTTHSPKLHINASYFRALVESAPDAIVITDTEGRIVLVNAQTEVMFGYRREDLEGKLVEVLVPQRYRSRHPDLRLGFTAAPLTRPMGAGVELFAQRKNGSEFPVLISLSPIRSEEGLSIFSAIRDITQQRKAEHSIRELNALLARQNKELKAVNQELEAFSYSVSHDLRAPLRAIDGFSRILLQEQAENMDEVGRDQLDRVRHATQHMGRLIDDLLKLARVARSELQMQEVDLSALANEVFDTQLQMAQQMTPERKLVFTCAPGLKVRGDAKLLRIALDNLIGNAMKFTGTRAEARIEFGMREEATGPDLAPDSGPVFFISDNGVGFNMEYADKLFGAFQRLHDTNEFPGTGIGLATVQRIIHKHGGRIWAQAAVDAGACFYFTLA
jgi:PAS domain S-box-containing protein